MIISRLHGGLGNQMFQYALGKVLAIKNDTSLQLDLRNYQSNIEGDTLRKYELGVFKLSENVVTLIPKVKKRNRLTARILNVISHYRKDEANAIKEKSHKFDKEILKTSDGMQLVGFWQSEKYFKKYAPIIRSDFEFRNFPNIKNDKLIKDIKSKNSVSLHIRRGDYVSNKSTSSFHGVCSLDYYKTAIEKIKSEIKNPRFYIFSDDIEWCRENIKPGKDTVYINHNKGKNSFEDMRLMSVCKYNIIANSSFSWWGAWLNQNKNKVVIAPKEWFQEKSINTKDVIPNKWIKI